MKRIINKIDWILFAILLFAAFAPLIYKGYRLFLVSHMDNETLSIAINWGYIYMIFESVNIFVIVPSYWFIRRNADTIEESNRNMIIILLFTCVAFIVSVSMVSVLGVPIALTSYNDAINGGIDASFKIIYGYIVTYGISLSLHLFTNVLIVYIIVHNRKLQAFLLTILTLMLSMIVDTLLIGGINPDANLLSISLSMFISSFLILIVVLIFVWFVNSKAWKSSFSLVTKENLVEGWRVYAKNGMFLGLEALYWNLLNALGVFIWFLACDSGVETAFWIMDGLFWGFLLLPATAVSMFTAEGISNESETEGKKDVIKVSFFLSFMALLSWIILVPLLVFFVIPVVVDESPEVIKMAQTMCWVFLLFIAIQVPSRVIYTYFSTTNRSAYLLAGTMLGTSMTWGLSFVGFLVLYLAGIIGGDSGNYIDSFYWIIPLIYGLGILFIFIFYMTFYILTMNDNDDSPGLVQRWRMRHELVKAASIKES